MTSTRGTPALSVSYAGTGASTRSNELGMRPMQERVWQRRGEQYLLIKSPPASGKSRALMFIALDELEKQGLRQAIVVVPERTIGASFQDTRLREHGFWADWSVGAKWNLCNAPGPEDGGKVKAAKTFLDSEDKILVCTHATFRFATDRFGAEAFDGGVIAVDEFHHVSANLDNRLGEHVGQLMGRDRTYIIAMTGSYFRGDAEPVLMPEDEARFETFTARPRSAKQPRPCGCDRCPRYGEGGVRLDLVRPCADRWLPLQPDGGCADHRAGHPRRTRQDPRPLHQSDRRAGRFRDCRCGSGERHVEGCCRQPADGTGIGAVLRLHSKDAGGRPRGGRDYGEGGYDKDKCNVSLDDGAKIQVGIKGLAAPTSEQAKRVCQEDLNEVVAAFVQDKVSVERGTFDEELVPEELTRVRLGKIVQDRYPELSEADQEAVRQQAVAALNLTQKAREAVLDQAAAETSGNTALIDGVRKFAMDVRDLDIDLIDRINPFGQAYAILAKSMGEDGDIFERLYAVRLGRVREQQECRDLLTSFDNQGLLSGPSEATQAEALDDDTLLAELGVETEVSDIEELRYVRSST